MTFKSRKLHVWLISAGAIIAIYLFYNLISRTPPIKINPAETAAGGKLGEFDDNVGKVGNVGVGTIQKARYAHLNTQKQVDREFGFEKLLHAEGNEWEIEKPYMNIYRHNLKSYMTADKGTVRIEDAVGRPTPTDATLSGNVVIHILPEKDSSIEESFIYLDDVIFTSEKSQFSSAGPVKLTSRDAQMVGRGLEIVYNDETNHLEFLKIISLEFLRIRVAATGQGMKSSKASLFSPAPVSPDVEKGSPASLPQTGQGKYYKCVFKGNVVIDCPEQVILADEVSISDILWSKVSDEESESEAGGASKEEISGKVPEEPQGGPASQPAGPNESAGQFADIVITCDNGIAVVPVDSAGTVEETAADDKVLKTFNDKKGRTTFIAKKIDYSLITEAIIADRSSELTFYAYDFASAPQDENDIRDAGSKAVAIPVKITAQETAEFRPRSNQVIFEGDVLCTMLRENTNFQQKYNLSAPKLTVDLSQDKQSRADIKHLTASGGVVQIDTSKWTGEELLGFTKLKCLQFDYDTAEQTFLAAGSGIIAVDNSRIAETGKKAGNFSLQRPCYVVVRNFDTLKYLKKADMIIADAASEQILIDYFPVVNGEQQQQTLATANHIEAALYETDTGQTELSTLSAKGGITYEEERSKKGKTVQFVGSGMFYDNSKSVITAWGDESQQCFLNGARAPGIEYDLKSGRIETKITGPGTLQMGR